MGRGGREGREGRLYQTIEARTDETKEQKKEGEEEESSNFPIYRKSSSEALFSFSSPAYDDCAPHTGRWNILGLTLPWRRDPG